MSLKVFCFLIGFIAIVVIEETVPQTQAPVTIINLDVIDNPQYGNSNEQALKCKIRNENDENISEIIVKVGSSIRLKFYSRHFLNKVKCDHLNNENELELLHLRNNVIETNDFTVDEYMESTWKCAVYTNKGASGPLVQRENGTSYYISQCIFNMTVLKDRVKDQQPKNSTSLNFFADPVNLKYIYIAVGVIVAIIVVAQTGVILYFKSKARKMARMRRISHRASSDNVDKKRYITASATRPQKGKISAWLAKKNNKNESDIYETLEEIKGIGTPPVPPIETIPSLKRPVPKTSEDPTGSLKKRTQHTQETPLQERQGGNEINDEVDITRRPPLPLPIEQVKRDQTPSPRMPPKKAASPQPMETRAGPSGASSLVKPKPGPGQITLTNELENKLKMRKDSTAQATKLSPPSPPKKPNQRNMSAFKRVSLSMRNTPKTDSENDFSSNPHRNFQLPKNPSPMPTGKSAVLLGLIPPPPKPAKPPMMPPVLAKTPPNLAKSKPTLAAGPPTFAKPPTGLAMTPPSVRSAAVLPRPSPLSRPSPVQSRPSPVLPRPSPVLPRPHPTLPQQSLANALRARTKPPAQVPVEALHQPFPLPPGPMHFKPPLPSPDNDTTVEQVYEEFNERLNEHEEQIYNSDEEWTYEPLEKFNIYSA